MSGPDPQVTTRPATSGSSSLRLWGLRGPAPTLPCASESAGDRSLWPCFRLWIAPPPTFYATPSPRPSLATRKRPGRVARESLDALARRPGRSRASGFAAEDARSLQRRMPSRPKTKSRSTPGGARSRARRSPRRAFESLQRRYRASASASPPARIVSWCRATGAATCRLPPTGRLRGGPRPLAGSASIAAAPIRSMRKSTTSRPSARRLHCPTRYRTRHATIWARPVGIGAHRPARQYRVGRRPPMTRRSIHLFRV